MRVVLCVLLVLAVVSASSSSASLDRSTEEATIGRHQSVSPRRSDLDSSVGELNRASPEHFSLELAPAEAVHARIEADQLGKRDVDQAVRTLQRRDLRSREQWEAEARRRRTQRNEKLCLLGILIVGCGAAIVGPFAAVDRYWMPYHAAQTHRGFAPLLQHQREEAQDLSHLLQHLQTRPEPIHPAAHAALQDHIQLHHVDAQRIRKTQQHAARLLHHFSYSKKAKDALRAFHADLTKTVQANEELQKQQRQMSTAKAHRFYKGSEDNMRRVAQIRQQMQQWDSRQSGVPQPETGTTVHAKQNAEAGTESGEQRKTRNKQQAAASAEP